MKKSKLKILIILFFVPIFFSGSIPEKNEVARKIQNINLEMQELIHYIRNEKV